MQAFATLLDRLVYTPSRNGKLALLERYFAETPNPARGWALASIAGDLDISLPIRRILGLLLDGRVDPELYRLSRDYVGDTAETVALLWPEPEAPDGGPSLDTVVDTIRNASRGEVPRLLEGWLDRLDATGRWALLKLLTGALRVGVSARLAKQAAAQYGGKDVAEVEEVWHGLRAPYTELFAWLDGKADVPDISGVPVFRPLMLANPLEDRDLELLDVSQYAAEWKWDGIRVQIASIGGDTRLYSRTGDDIGTAFPDVVAMFDEDIVLDGELLVVRDEAIAPFNDLQQRLNRKAVTPKMLRTYPAHVRLYDILREGDMDLRELAWSERRARLEAWAAKTDHPRIDVSDIVEAENKADLEAIWAETRGIGIEGLMLKRRESAYYAGRPKGHWFKWKRAPLTLDTVLMYAERGSGKRSSFYSDYTFGTWAEADDGARELVPVGKAYSGFTDEELKKLDKFVRANTTQRFGPVRAVAEGIVFEVAFDAVHHSPRHKSGVAMRFPRIHRIRWDKPPEEADTLETVLGLIEKRADTATQDDDDDTAGSDDDGAEGKKRAASEPEPGEQLSLF
ncbi:MAG: cisplatin damage response ATP-dependent DNA ligase [Pseudomonadota bacterium]